MDTKKTFEKLYKDHAAEIFRFCMFKSNNKEHSEDTVAETFIKLYEQDLNTIENPRAWLFKVSRNIMINNYIKTKKQTDWKDENNEIASFNEQPIEKQAFDEFTLNQIQNELTNLDELTSEVITLRTWEDLEFSEIADVTGLTIDAVKRRYYRGIEQLKNNISANEKLEAVSLKLGVKNVAIPVVLSAIFSLSLQPAYAMSAASSAAIVGSIGSALGLSAGAFAKAGFTLSNLSTMNSTNMSGATAGSVVGAGAASLTTGSAIGAGGLLATTTAKLIAGTALLVGGTGVGLGVVNVANNQDFNEQNQPEQESPDSGSQILDDGCDIKTYTNSNYPDFSFEYDPCEWELSELTTYTAAIDGSELSVEKATEMLANTAGNNTGLSQEVKVTLVNNSYDYNLDLRLFGSNTLPGVGTSKVCEKNNTLITNIGNNVIRRDFDGTTYYTMIMPKGTSAFEAAKTSYIEGRQIISQPFEQDPDFCYSTANLYKLIKNSNPAFNYTYTMFSVSENNEGIFQADKVVKSINWLGKETVSEAKQTQNLVYGNIPTYQEIDYNDTTNAISRFYTYIDDGEFDKAYELSSKKLSLSEFKNLYRNVTHVISGISRDIGNNSYEVYVALEEGGYITTYKVTLNMILDDKQETTQKDYRIGSSTSVAYSGLVYLDCSENPELSTGTLCYVRDLETGDHLPISTIAYINARAFFMGKTEGDYQYIYNSFGDAGFAHSTYYRFDKNRNKLSFIGEYTTDFMSAEFDKDGKNRNCKNDTLEDYYADCLKQFENEDWYKSNVEFLEAERRYI